MTDANHDVLNEAGQYYNFRSPLRHNEYFAITPTHQPPHGYKPIIDEKSGVCIGYSVAQAPGLWQIYDSDGRFAALEESPLETPIIDPIDITLIMFGAFRLLSSGRVMLEAAAGNKIKAFLSESTLNILKGRFKVGLSASSLKFTRTTANRMSDPGRYIPIQILEKAVRFGKRSADAQKIAGQFEYRIGMSRLTKKTIGNEITYTHKNFTLHVLVRERDWTVMHFHIQELK